MLADIITFLGHFHPMVVHLPIGFLLLGVGFNILSYYPKYSSLAPATSIALLAGFLSAIAACLLGYALSLTGDYDPEILENHLWAGITLAVGAGFLWSMTTPFWPKNKAIPRKVFTAICVVMTALVAYTGHQGASLTHGSDYLSAEVLTRQKRVLPSSPEEALVFEDVVHPLLIKRCEPCHRKGKRKGELIMTSYDDLMKGGEHGPVITAGKPDDSELYRRITLDPAHEDFMPTDGKTPLTKTEVEVIRWWIAEGEAQRGRALATFDQHATILPLVAGLLEFPGAPPLPEEKPGGAVAVNPLIPDTVDMTAVDVLRSKGLNVRVMLHTPVMLDVTLPAGSQVKVAAFGEALEAVAANVVWLNLSGNDLTESELSILKQLANLEKLRLERNPVGDGIVDLLNGLEHLEAVNLNETRLTTKGLTRLQEHPSLKRIYAWKTPAQQSVPSLTR